MDYDEVHSIANYVYVKSKNSHDPEKAKFSTFFYNCLKYELVEHIRRNPLIMSTETDEYISESDMERKIEFSNHLDNTLNSIGKEICEFILGDSEIHQLVNKPKKMKGMLKKKLREQGWKWENIWAGFKDIETCLSKF